MGPSIMAWHWSRDCALELKPIFELNSATALPDSARAHPGSGPRAKKSGWLNSTVLGVGLNQPLASDWSHENGYRGIARLSHIDWRGTGMARRD